MIQKIGYNHDIFLSYMHDDQNAEWVHQHLIPFMKTFVGNALNRPIDVFVDRDRISTGDSWPLRLKNALACSRCLVAVWSPLYFHSIWCRHECKAMLYREARLNYRTIEKPTGLVIPVTVFDGEYFPELTRDIQWLDCKKYWIVGEGFKKTEKYVEFQELLQNWAYDVAKAINMSPPWQESWLSDAWLDIPDDDLHPKPTTNFDFVGLE